MPNEELNGLINRKDIFDEAYIPRHAEEACCITLFISAEEAKEGEEIFVLSLPPSRPTLPVASLPTPLLCNRQKFSYVPLLSRRFVSS